MAENPKIKQEQDKLKQIARRQQGEAANPEFSVWVEASAGTGKTKVLSDRVLRLLLNGVSPERILCLTYTKAAAVEMNARISARLAKWAVVSDDKLKEGGAIRFVMLQENLSFGAAVAKLLPAVCTAYSAVVCCLERMDRMLSTKEVSSKSMAWIEKIEAAWIPTSRAAWS